MNTEILMEKVAEVAPQIFDYMCKTAEEVRESPFRDEIITRLNGILKKAEVASSWGNLGRGLAGTAVTTAGAGIALALAGDMYSAVRRGITKGRDYRSMMSGNPDLKQMHAPRVQRLFSTLHRFNPEYAADPDVAGSFIRNNMAYDKDKGVDMSQVLAVSGARQGVQKGRELPGGVQKPAFMGEPLPPPKKGP